MTRAKEVDIILEITNEMKQTIEYIRDADKNARYPYTPDQVRNNMMQYFTGLSFSLEKITGKEYHWTNNDNGYALVTIDTDGSELYEYI